MYITFENDIGSIRITGGSEGVWRLIEADGLDSVSYDVQAVYMKGREGRTTTALQSLERAITLKGDIAVKNSTALLTKATQLLDREGILKIMGAGKERMIKARCTAFTAERERGGIRPFVMQFICDDPFFTDLSVKEADIATVEKLLYGSLDLTEGIYFSTGRTSAILTNSGIKNAEPVITIGCREDMQGDSITLTNSATGQSINLSLTLTEGDRLVIDIPNRSLTLNGAVRFDLLSPDSFLSDFHLAIGNNEVAVATNHNSDRLWASVSYYNKYNEAVV